MYNDYYNYGSSYGSYDSAATAGITAGLAIFYIFYLIICLGASVIGIIGMWKTFKKAGKEGWEAIVPFYNIWTLFEISGYPGAYMFFIFIPCAGPIILLIFEILAYISLSKKFHKSSGFAALLIILPFIGLPILGFGKDEYDATLGEHKNVKSTPTATATVTNNTNEEKFCGNCGSKVDSNDKHCANCGNEL